MSLLKPLLRGGFPISARSSRGQTLVEYTLILAVVSVVCIGVFGLLGQQVVRLFSSITTLLDSAQASH